MWNCCKTDVSGSVPFAFAQSSQFSIAVIPLQSCTLPVLFAALHVEEAGNADEDLAFDAMCQGQSAH